ncbi:MAG: aldolase/citrate lyase family protein [Acetobacteraceae bacterium]
MIRSLLYVPVSSERFVAKAHERGADAVVLDLEDGVAPGAKDAARAALPAAVTAVRRGSATVFVRVNAEEARLRLDLEAACRAGADGVFVPKARDPAALNDLALWLETIEQDIGRATMRFVPMLEDPGAVLDAPRDRQRHAAHPRRHHGRRGPGHRDGGGTNAGAVAAAQDVGPPGSEGGGHIVLRPAPPDGQLPGHRRHCRQRAGSAGARL